MLKLLKSGCAAAASLLFLPLTVSAHVCPTSDPQMYINSHSGAKLTVQQVRDARKAAGQHNNAAHFMKAKPGPMDMMESHDDPIIVEYGSVRVGFGKDPTLDGSGAFLTRHGCPMDHKVQVVTWNRGFVGSGTTMKQVAKASVVDYTLVYSSSTPNTIKMWPERKQSSGGFAAVANSGAPELSLTLLPAPNNTMEGTWKLERHSAAGLIQETAKQGNQRRFHYMDAAAVAAAENVRLGWLQLPGSQPILLRGACYLIQIYPVGSDTQAESDGKPMKVEDMNPPCKAAMEKGTTGPGVIKGKAEIKDKKFEQIK